MAPVPDAEALRRAALQASWQRGRWVARRRVALRWALWASTRYLMPALAVSGAAAWLWLGVLPGLSGSSAWLAWGDGATAPSPSITPAASLPPQVTAAVAQVQPEMDTSPAEYSPEGEELPLPLALKFESRWAAVPPASPGGLALPGHEPDRDTIPSLKPENWLHSKEP